MPAFPPSLRPCHIPYLSFLISRSLPTPTPLCTRIAWFNQFLLSRTVLCLPTSLSSLYFCFAPEAKIDSVVKSSSSVRPFASFFSLYACAPRSPDLRQGGAELSVSGYWSHTDTHTWKTHTMSNALLMGGWLTRDQITDSASFGDEHTFDFLRVSLIVCAFVCCDVRMGQRNRGG